MSAVLLLAAVGLGIWFWQDSMRVRELAVGIGKKTCKDLDLQFLDGTVAMHGLGLGRDQNGHLQLRRTYRFDYTGDGATRLNASLEMLGGRLQSLIVGDVVITG